MNQNKEYHKKCLTCGIMIGLKETTMRMDIQLFVTWVVLLFKMTNANKFVTKISVSNNGMTVNKPKDYRF